MFTYSKLPPNVLKSGSYKYDAYGAWYVAVPSFGHDVKYRRSYFKSCATPLLETPHRMSLA